ncbi:MAG: hypothetical protein Q7S98_03025 [Deltaproteobacteria bacterium]|nr:hypothetical protein [Deltaproteobacteria bacterium]
MANTIDRTAATPAYGQTLPNGTQVIFDQTAADGSVVNGDLEAKRLAAEATRILATIPQSQPGRDTLATEIRDFQFSPPPSPANLLQIANRLVRNAQRLKDFDPAQMPNGKRPPQLTIGRPADDSEPGRAIRVAEELLAISQTEGTLLTKEDLDAALEAEGVNPEQPSVRMVLKRLLRGRDDLLAANLQVTGGTWYDASRLDTAIGHLAPLAARFGSDPDDKIIKKERTTQPQQQSSSTPYHLIGRTQREPVPIGADEDSERVDIQLLERNSLSPLRLHTVREETWWLLNTSSGRPIRLELRLKTYRVAVSEPYQEGEVVIAEIQNGSDLKALKTKKGPMVAIGLLAPEIERELNHRARLGSLESVMVTLDGRPVNYHPVRPSVAYWMRQQGGENIPTIDSLHYAGKVSFNSPVYRPAWALWYRELLSQYQGSPFQQEYKTADGRNGTLTIISLQGRLMMVAEEETGVSLFDPLFVTSIQIAYDKKTGLPKLRGAPRDKKDEEKPERYSETRETVIELAPNGVVSASGEFLADEPTVDRLIRSAATNLAAGNDQRAIFEARMTELTGLIGFVPANDDWLATLPLTKRQARRIKNYLAGRFIPPDDIPFLAETLRSKLGLKNSRPESKAVPKEKPPTEIPNDKNRFVPPIISTRRYSYELLPLAVRKRLALGSLTFGFSAITPDEWHSLTPGQRDTVELALEGLAPVEIAPILGIDKNTVVQNILEARARFLDRRPQTPDRFRDFYQEFVRLEMTGVLDLESVPTRTLFAGIDNLVYRRDAERQYRQGSDDNLTSWSLSNVRELTRRSAARHLLPMAPIEFSMRRAEILGTLLPVDQLPFLTDIQRAIVEGIDAGATDTKALMKRLGRARGTIDHQTYRIRTAVARHFGEEHVRENLRTALRWWLTGSFLVTDDRTLEERIDQLPARWQVVVRAYLESGNTRIAATKLRMQERDFQFQLNDAILAMRLETAQSDPRARTYIDPRFDPSRKKQKPSSTPETSTIQYRHSPEAAPVRDNGELLAGANRIDLVPVDPALARFTTDGNRSAVERTAEMTEGQGRRVFAKP